jgi:hypothetical protein
LAAIPESPVAVVWIQTQNVNVSALDCLPDDLRQRVHIIDLCSHNNSFGWDDDGDDDGVEDISNSDIDRTTDHGATTLKCSMNDLSRLFHEMRDQLYSINKPVIIIWQSLVPLFVLHGYDKVLFFLSRLTLSSTTEAKTKTAASRRRILPNCLQVWPVDRERLTSQQHAKLEDLSHAIMFFNSGELTVMRRGIRERDNLLRDVVPYELVRETIPLSKSSSASGCLYYRVDELSTITIENEGTKKRQTSASSMAADMESITLDDSRTKNKKSGVGVGGNMKSTSSRSGRVQLRLEDDEEKNHRPRGHATVQQHDHSYEQRQHQEQHSRPRIYLEDNDPEFADLDEDDPDDDLDF